MATITRPERPREATIETETATAPPKGKAAPNKRRFLLPIVAILGVLGIIWGVKTWNYSRAHETTDDAQVDGHIIPVLAKVGGYVDRVYADENTHSNEGAPAVLIDTSEYHVRVELAKADLAAAATATGSHAITGQAVALVQTATQQSAAADAQIVAAQANYDKAKADLARLQELVAKQIVSRQQLDAAQAAADGAQATLLAAERQSAAGVATVSNAQAGVRLAAARLAGAQASLDNAVLQLSYAKIAAPASGIMNHKAIEPGQLVQPGQALFNIVTDTGAFLAANFKETQLDHIRVGQKVTFEVDAYDGATAEGVVESLSAATGAKDALLPPDNATGNFTKVVQRVPVRIRVTRDLGPERPLRPGMSVTVHVATR